MKVNLKGLCSFIFLFLFSASAVQAQGILLSPDTAISVMLMESYTNTRSKYKDVCGTEVAPSACGEACRASTENQEICTKYRTLCGNVTLNSCERISNQILLVLMNYEAMCGDATPDACQAGACSESSTASDELRRTQCTNFVAAYREKCNNETSAACRTRLMRPRPAFVPLEVGATVDPGALATAPVVPRDEADPVVRDQQDQQQQQQQQQPQPDPRLGGATATPDTPSSGPCSLMSFASSGSWLGNAWLGLALLVPVSLRMRKKR